MKTLLLKLFQRRLDKTLKNTVGRNSTVTGNGKEDSTSFHFNLYHDLILESFFLSCQPVISKRNMRKVLLAFHNSPIFPYFPSPVYYTYILQTWWFTEETSSSSHPILLSYCRVSEQWLSCVLYELKHGSTAQSDDSVLVSWLWKTEKWNLQYNLKPFIFSYYHFFTYSGKCVEQHLENLCKWSLIKRKAVPGIIQ